MQSRWFSTAAAAVIALALGASDAHAGQALTVRVADADGQPVANAAVVLDVTASASAVQPPSTDRPSATVVVDQRDERFVPAFTVVRTGDSVRFPNNDRVMHHVYSFSQAKRFELPLYREEAPNPVLMDTPGMVVIGCNIHDQMIGHILVVDSSHFAMTDADGVAVIAAPAAGDLTVWYRTATGVNATERALESIAGAVEINVGASAVAARTRETRTLRWNEDY